MRRPVKPLSLEYIGSNPIASKIIKKKSMKKDQVGEINQIIFDEKGNFCIKKIKCNIRVRIINQEWIDNLIRLNDTKEKK